MSARHVQQSGQSQVGPVRPKYFHEGEVMNGDHTDMSL